MNHVTSLRAHVVSRRGLAIAVVATLCLHNHDASAQLGGLVKKARDKAVEKQVEKRVGGASSSNPGAPPKFDNVTVELTADRVGQILRGFAAGRAILDGTNGGASRSSLVTRRDEASRKREALNDANMRAFNAYTREARREPALPQRRHVQVAGAAPEDPGRTEQPDVDQGDE